MALEPSASGAQPSLARSIASWVLLLMLYPIAWLIIGLGLTQLWQGEVMVFLTCAAMVWGLVWAIFKIHDLRAEWRSRGQAAGLRAG